MQIDYFENFVERADITSNKSTNVAKGEEGRRLENM